jgi:hypothetical protein
VRPPGGGGLRALLRCGRRKKTVGWAVRAGWVGREAKALWGEGGGRLGKKEKRCGHGWAERPDGLAGRWTDWAESEGKIPF